MSILNKALAVGVNKTATGSASTTSGKVAPAKLELVAQMKNGELCRLPFYFNISDIEKYISYASKQTGVEAKGRLFLLEELKSAIVSGEDGLLSGMDGLLSKIELNLEIQKQDLTESDIF